MTTQAPPAGPRAVNLSQTGICMIDSPEGKSTGMNLYRAADGFHTRDLHDDDVRADGLPAALARALDAAAAAGDYVPWARPAALAGGAATAAAAAAAADRALGSGTRVLLRTEAGERWLGSAAPGAEAALARALRAAAMDAAAAAAADAAVDEPRVLALAQVTVALRPEALLGGVAPPDIVVNAGAGRLARPLLRADAEVGTTTLLGALRGPPAAARGVADWVARLPSLRAAVAARAATFLDPSAAANAVVGSAKDTWWHADEPYTHLEPHAALKLSLNLVGLACMEHNPVPRLPLAATHNKQRTQNNYNEAGVPFRSENMLATGTAPALRGAADGLLRTQELATGELATVIIGSAGGDNREVGVGVAPLKPRYPAGFLKNPFRCCCGA